MGRQNPFTFQNKQKEKGCQERKARIPEKLLTKSHDKEGAIKNVGSGYPRIKNIG